MASSLNENEAVSNSREPFNYEVNLRPVGRRK